MGDEGQLYDGESTDITDFEDHWGVERQGGNKNSSDKEDDDDESEGGEMMPIPFF